MPAANKPKKATPKHPKQKPQPPPKPPAYNYIRFSTKNGEIDPVTVLLGEGSVKIDSGYGGWTVKARQNRVGITIWEGKDPFRMSLPILFDGYQLGNSQELAISRLSRMALPPNAGVEPPALTISGAGIPQAGPTDWVIESIDWGDNVIWDFSNKGVMSRLRQDATVHLMQYVQEDRIAFKKIGQKATAPASTVAPHGWQKSVTVKAGEKSLRDVAKRVYKPVKPNDWKLIAKANGINDPKNIHVGQTLRIPKK